VFSAEDNAEDTILPRLEAAGANPDLVFVLEQPDRKWCQGNGVSSYFS
jgi:hypothetical protein